MAELKALLQAYLRGQGTYEQLGECLDRLLTTAPASANDCRRLLQAARKAGLAQDVYAALNGQIGEILARPPADFPDNVVLDRPPVAAAAPPQDPDATALSIGRGGSRVTAGVTPATDATLRPQVDDRGAGERGDVTRGRDDDAARRPEPDHPTGARHRGPGATTAHGDPTGHDDDATRLPEPDRPGGARDRGPDASTARVDLTGDHDDDATRLPEPDRRGGARDRGPGASTARVDLTGNHDDDATRLPEPGDPTGARDRGPGATAARGDVTGRAAELEAETALNAAAGPGEPTATGAGATGDDATEVYAGEDATETGPGADTPRSGQSTAAGTEWSAGGAGVTREFRENDKLRGRFELISKLGEGGMGAVWKGRDLLKVEARDRNPFVAIKLLQGDFKGHPEAFIALQRETAKQQRLAHPNIATVFDFDRDDSTQTVFMTMEVLEGQPLDAFIRRMPADGLPEAEAMNLIEQLCAGLAYAHGHGLVHSDLKPGNCYVTRNGSLKLLDFGIARASKTMGDTEGETTLFDPGKLGALTPNYATLEMFEAQHPDPRDDIYALAIIAYQFFTGRHPFGRKSAPKALELGLVPPPVEKLNKRQNRGLARALAFRREDRTPSVEEFLHDLQRRKNRLPVYAGAGIGAAVLIGVLAMGPITEYANRGKRDEIAHACERGRIDGLRECLSAIAAWQDPAQQQRLLDDARVRAAVIGHIARGDQASIEEGLAAIAGFDPGWQQDIRDAGPAREAIVELFESRIDAAFAPEQGRYDHARALELVEQLDALYPDSAQVLRIGNGIEADRQAELSALSDRYNAYLADGRLVGDPDAGDIGDVLDVIRRLDPEHRLLADERLRFRFAELAEAAIAAGDYRGADALLAASADHAPDDPALEELRLEVRTQLERMANERRVAELEQRLAGQLERLGSLDDFQAVREDLIELDDLAPASGVLDSVRQRLAATFSSEVGGHIAAGRWQDAERVLATFAKLLEIPDLTAQRAALSAAESRAGFSLAPSPERERAIAERARTVRVLLASPGSGADWETRLEVPYKELVGMLPPGDPVLEPLRDETAALYLERARRARAAERFAEALAHVETGRLFYPGLARFDEETALVTEARKAQRERRAVQARAARIEGLKEDFRTKTANDELPEATALLGQLTEELAAGDRFLAREPPALLAGAYLRRARRQAERDNYLEALTLAEAGLAVAPRLPGLADTVAGYRARVAERENELELRRLFNGTGALDVAAVRTRLASLERTAPARYPALHDAFAASRGRQIAAMAGAEQPAIQDLARRLDEYRELFPAAHEAVARQVVEEVERHVAALPATSVRQLEHLRDALAGFGKLAADRRAALARTMAERAARRIDEVARRSRGQAYRMLVAARAAFGARQPALERLAHLRPPPGELPAALEAIERGELSGARTRLEQARAADASHPDLAAALRRLEARERAARERYAAYRAEVERSKSPRDQKRFDRELKTVKALWSDNPEFQRAVVRRPVRGECTEELAGYGARRGGSCYDLIGKHKGPEMVVVPSGSGIGAPFAIGKYEVTVNDYDLFCRETGSCQPRGRQARRLPITGISVDDARRYARWLSEQVTARTRTTVVYRLPMVAEWEHAARASGTQPEKKFNCRVTSGNNDIIAGHALVDARSGKANGWGLMNYVGNAQEWVQSGSGVVVRGGTFADPLAKCELSISRSHAGTADATTGFRLVRELG